MLAALIPAVEAVEAARCRPGSAPVLAALIPAVEAREAARCRPGSAPVLAALTPAVEAREVAGAAARSSRWGRRAWRRREPARAPWPRSGSVRAPSRRPGRRSQPAPCPGLRAPKRAARSPWPSATARPSAPFRRPVSRRAGRGWSLLPATALAPPSGWAMPPRRCAAHAGPASGECRSSIGRTRSSSRSSPRPQWPAAGTGAGAPSLPKECGRERRPGSTEP